MLKILKKYVRGKALLCAIIAPLCMLLEVFMDLQMPTMMSDIIDIGVAGGDVGYILNSGLRMIVYAFLGVLGGASCSVFATYTSTQAGGALRQDLFHKIQTLSCREVDKLGTSSLVVRLTNDVVQVQEMIMMLLRSFVRSPMLFFGGIAMSFLLSPRLAVILCVILPILAVSAFVIISQAVPMYTTVQARIDGMNTVVRENLLGLRVIKAFTLEAQQFGRFNKANKGLVDDSIKAHSTTFLLMPIVTLVMNLSVVAVLWFGGNMEISGNLPTGRIMALINYMVQITNALVMLVNLVVNVSRANASAIRIAEVLDIQPDLSVPAAFKEPEGNDIIFENVSFRYSTGEYALKNISCQLKSGQRIGIIGGTGCGKSTLVNLITRMYDVSDGRITLGGQDVKDIPLAQLRGKVGMVLQESILFSGTIHENLHYGNETATEEEMYQASVRAEAAPFIMQLPKKFDSVVEQRGKNFSGGQKQRLSISRTLLQNPDILIMDDSTSALDFMTEARLQQAVQEQMAGHTFILIAQRISSIMDCDMILVLDNGCLAATGTHRELIRDCEIYRSIAVSQLGEEAIRYAG